MDNFITNEVLSEEELKEAVKKGIIDLAGVREKIEMANKKEILEQHENFSPTWQATDGRFKTYLPDSKRANGRRLVAKTSRNSLETAIILFYTSQEEKNKGKTATLRSLYSEWIGYKIWKRTSDSTIMRYDNAYKKYYQDDPIIDIPIVDLSEKTLKEWTENLILSNDLSRSQSNNALVIFRLILDYSVEVLQIISENHFRKPVFAKLLPKKKKKPVGRTQVFLVKEEQEIVKLAYKDFEETGQSACLAIPFAFYTGLRLGELVALKTSDIDENFFNYIHIQRMDVKEGTRDNEENSWSSYKRVIVPHTKSSAGDRDVYLSLESRKIIELLLESYKEKSLFSNENFLFLNDEGKRITPFSVSCRIQKYCREIGIPVKSIHKARKTYISKLIDARVNLDEVRKLAGHEDERTTLGCYTFNRLDEEQTESLLEDALNG